MKTITGNFRFSVIGVTLGVIAISPVAMGGDLTIPKTWSDNETLTAEHLNSNFQATEIAVDGNANAIDENTLRLPLLKTISFSESVTVDTARRYFGNGHLTATPPSDGYLYIEANAVRNCPGDQLTRAWYGVYVTNVNTVPDGSVPFTHAEVYGFAFPIEASPNGGNHNVRIMYPHVVSAGVEYYIWYGVQGLQVSTPCTLVDPTITATFFQSGL